MSWIELVAQRRPPQAPAGMQPPENAKDWFRVENSADDPEATDILVYDSIGGWFGMWAEDMVSALKEITTSKINLRLNSPGGSVFEGITIANALRAHPANVTVYVDGIAASIASVIALAGDRLVMMPQSQLMVHNASGACYGDATEMTAMADLLDKQSLNIAQAYAEHTGRPLAEWQDYMAAETWFTAAEAVAVGLADEAMPMKPKKQNQDADDAPMPAPATASMSKSWDLSMYHYAGREKAPAPVIPEPAITDKVFAAGGVITAEMISSALLSNDFQASFKALLREVVHDELAVIEGTACPTHSTAVKDGTWDAGANEGHLPSPVPVATVKKVYAYYDEDKVEDGDIPKSAAKLPHHFVSADGTPGAASINGVRNALARLPQTQGLTDAERSAAEAHLRAHLNAYGGSDDHTHDDHVHDEAVEEAPVAAGDPPPVPDNASPKSPPPDEEEEEGEEEGDDEPPGEEDEPKPKPKNQADDTNPFVGLFHATSPSADDVFAHLKEGW